MSMDTTTRRRTVLALHRNSADVGRMLADYACLTIRTAARDDMLDSLSLLSREQQDALAGLCESILDRVSTREPVDG